MADRLVVVIILNHDKKEDALRCLDSVARLDYSPIETVVVDNGSRDGSAEAIRAEFPRVHLIENKINAGVAGGRNVGIRYAREKFDYRFLFFLDNDVVIEAGALSEMVKAFDSREHVGIVSPKCYRMNAPGIIRYAGGMSVNLYTGRIADIGNGEKDEGQFDEPRFVSACGGLCLVGREAMDKIGGFDETFNPYGWEDVDFSMRAGELGYKILYNPKAIIHHKGGRSETGRAVGEYEFSKARNYFYLMGKHAGPVQRLCLGMIFPFRALQIAAVEVLRGEFGITLSRVRGFLSRFGTD